MIYLVGGFSDTIDLTSEGHGTLTSAGDYDAFIAAIDSSDGSIEHVKTFGGTGRDYFWSISCDDTDAYVSGTFGGSVTVEDTTYTPSGSGDIWLMRINLK